MKYIINDQVVLSLPLEGPLAEHISPFADWVRTQGYGRWSVHRQVLIAAGFSRWLGQHAVRLCDVSTEQSARYLRERVPQARPRVGDAAALKYLLEFLRGEGAIPEQAPSSEPTPVERCTQAFAQYLREDRGLVTATIINYTPFIRSFLKDRFGTAAVMLSSLGASDVVGFVRRQAPRLHLKRAKLLTTALRSFLQYARCRGEVTVDLAAAVPVIANWSMASLPRAIAPDQVRRLLEGINRGTATGSRDYAILLLLARLGLRAGEVVSLELEDINWNRGELSVRGKRGQRHTLPLPAEVGKALAAYLRRGRPGGPSRRVFLRARAPIRGIQSASGIGSIVRRWLKRAGVKAPTYGAHQFRHGLATEMLRQGASLSEIGEVLGHRHPQTTSIYAKVDIDALRELALPWPGGVR